MTIAAFQLPASEVRPTPIPMDAPVPNPLPRLLAGEDLPIEDSRHLFERLVLGRLSPPRLPEC